MLPSGHRPLMFGYAPVSGLRIYLYHLGVGLPDGKLVATYGDLDRITERRRLAHMKGRALRDAHIHNSSLDGTLAGDLRYNAILTWLNLS